MNLTISYTHQLFQNHSYYHSYFNAKQNWNWNSFQQWNQRQTTIYCLVKCFLLLNHGTNCTSISMRKLGLWWLKWKQLWVTSTGYFIKFCVAVNPVILSSSDTDKLRRLNPQWRFCNKLKSFRNVSVCMIISPFLNFCKKVIQFHWTICFTTLYVLLLLLSNTVKLRQSSLYPYCFTIQVVCLLAEGRST